MRVNSLKERIFSSLGNQVNISQMVIIIVGSVPTCYVAGQLWDEYNDAKEAGSNPSIPVAGIILHAALYTGRCLYSSL